MIEQRTNILQERAIALPASPLSTVVRIKFAVRCDRCGAEWGITMLPNLSMPLGWDTCLKCRHDQMRKPNEDVNQASQTSQIIVEGKTNGHTETS